MSFKEMKKEGYLPGPQGMIISGYDENDSLICEALIRVISGMEITGQRVLGSGLTRTFLENLTDEKSDELPMDAAKLPQVILFSGLPFDCIHEYINQFNTTELPRPLFATSTETNLDFTLKYLLSHLLEEHREMMEMHRKRQQEEGA